MSIIWLASYPKSGNTWVRVFLTNYLEDRDEPADINAIRGGWSHLERDQFDETLGLPSSDMTENELNHYRPAFHAALAENAEPPLFIKSHEAYRRFPTGQSLFAPVEGCKAIHLVRNPFDVAISFAHHNAKSVDRTIKKLGNPKSKMSGGPFRFVEFLDNWSGFNESWMDQSELPVLTLRYEDMLSDTEQCFTEIIRFTELDFDQARLEKALAFSAFDEVQRQEKEKGFRERQPTAQSFFRNGKIGDGERILSAEQANRIAGDHAGCMARLGYESALTA